MGEDTFNTNGKYDHILVKNADIQYKLMMAELAKANELAERNRLKRIELALQVIHLGTGEREKIEGELSEELDLADNA